MTWQRSNPIGDLLNLLIVVALLALASVAARSQDAAN